MAVFFSVAIGANMPYISKLMYSSWKLNSQEPKTKSNQELRLLENETAYGLCQSFLYPFSINSPSKNEMLSGLLRINLDLSEKII